MEKSQNQNLILDKGNLLSSINVNESAIYYIALLFFGLLFIMFEFTAERETEITDDDNEHIPTENTQNKRDVIRRPVQCESDEYYDMSASPKGICLIINNEHFKNSATRTGSNWDLERLKTLFEKLNFIIIIGKNLDDCDLVETFKRVSVEVKSEHNCFVCFISSHGTGDSILCANEKLVPLSKIKKFFSASQCRALSGKPKLFFIQACRNKQTEQRSDCQSDVIAESWDGPKDLHKESDFLLSFATTKGSGAFRNEEQGSLFLFHFVKLLDELRDNDLLSVLTQLNLKFVDQNELGVQQMPVFNSTLTKKVVLGNV